MTIGLKSLCVASLALLLAAAQTGHTHTRWDPNGLIKPRSTRDDIKRGPCGDTRTDTPVVLEAGSTIEVAFESTIFHEGVFRISFSPSDDQGFEQHVLADNIPDVNGQRFRTHTITLPEIECEACTLQLIQTMEDRNPPTNYFSCADIQLVAATPEPGDTTPPAPVVGLIGLPGDAQVNLMWTNPADADFRGVLLIQSQTALNTTPEAGETYQPGDLLGEGDVVLAGLAQTFTASELPAGDAYHFTAFAYDSSFNYSDAAAVTVSLPEEVPNIAPTVDLVVEQEGKTAPYIHTAAGEVLIQAQVRDINTGDTHSYDWSGTDSRLVNLDTSNSTPGSFRFNPTGFDPGKYIITVSVTDNGQPPQTTEATLELNAIANDASENGAGIFGGLTFWMFLAALGLPTLRSAFRP